MTITPCNQQFCQCSIPTNASCNASAFIHSSWQPKLKLDLNANRLRQRLLPNTVCARSQVSPATVNDSNMETDISHCGSKASVILDQCSAKINVTVGSEQSTRPLYIIPLDRDNDMLCSTVFCLQTQQSTRILPASSSDIQTEANILAQDERGQSGQSEHCSADCEDECCSADGPRNQECCCSPTDASLQDGCHIRDIDQNFDAKKLSRPLPPPPSMSVSLGFSTPDGNIISHTGGGLSPLMTNGDILTGPIALVMALIFAALGLKTAAQNGNFFTSRHPQKLCTKCYGYGKTLCDLCNASGTVRWEGKLRHVGPCPKCFGSCLRKCPGCYGK